MGSRRFLALTAGLSPTSAWWSSTAAARAEAAKPKPLEGDAALIYFDSI